MTRPSISSMRTKIESPFFKGMVPVYHSISSREEPSIFTSGIHDITSEQFEKQLVQLKRRHDFVLVDELAERVRKGKSIRKLVSVTFDDGYKNFFTNAIPVLEHLNIPTTMFLTTKILQGEVFWRDKIRLVMERHLVSDFLNYLEEKLKVSHDVTPEEFYQKSKDPGLFRNSDMNDWLDDYLTHKEIELLQLFKGLYLNRDDIRPHPLVQFGNHTENHFMMSSLDKEQQLQEIKNAEDYLKTLNTPLSKAFAIPFGNPGSYDHHTLDSAYELGYDTILLAQADRARGFVKNSKPTDSKALVGMRFLPGTNRLF